MKKQLVFFLICIFYITGLRGQSLCEPFYVIGESNQDKVWMAIFQGCMDTIFPLVKSDNNPLVRAQIISRHKIIKIKIRDSQDAVTSVEYFDKRGYKVFESSQEDTLNGTYYLNIFSETNLLSKIIYKNHYSITGARNVNSDTLHTVLRFEYDAAGNLIEKREKRLEPLKYFRNIYDHMNLYKTKHYKRPRVYTTTQTARYNARGNVTVRRTRGGSYTEFTYDVQNRLLIATDKSRGVSNAETLHFFYKETKLIDSINVISRSKYVKDHKILLRYDDEDRVISYTKYYSDGTVWEAVVFRYQNGLLIGIEDCFPLTDYCSDKQFYYNTEGLLQKIEFFRSKVRTHQTDYSYEYFKDI